MSSEVGDAAPGGIGTGAIFYPERLLNTTTDTTISLILPPPSPLPKNSTSGVVFGWLQRRVMMPMREAGLDDGLTTDIKELFIGTALFLTFRNRAGSGGYLEWHQ